MLGRLAWSQLRFRPARALALIAGVLAAATAFTVLTAAVALLPAVLLRRLPAARLLAEE